MISETELSKRRRIARRAICIKREKRIAYGQAIIIATEIEELIERMMLGTARFSFTGQDGDTHTQNGTLVTYESVFGREYESKPESIFVVFLDTDRNEWRTFQAAQVETKHVRQDV